jgi:hypothetical protein
MVTFLAENAVKSQIVQEVEKAFGVLNQELFGGRLVCPSVIFQPRMKHTIRWFPDTTDLSIGGDFAEVDGTEILADLLHEMVHIYNAAEGEVDCTSNSYHNRKFLAPALKVGLVVSHHKTQGWGLTGISASKRSLVPKKKGSIVDAQELPEAQDVQKREWAFYAAEIDQEVIRKAKSHIRSLNAPKRNGKVYFMKYACGCPGPHNSIRCGRKPDGPNRLNAVCGFCNKNFEVVREGKLQHSI